MLRILTIAVVSLVSLFGGLKALAADSASDIDGGIVGMRLQDKNGEDCGRIVATVENTRGAVKYILLMPEELNPSEDSLIPIPGKLIEAGKEGDALVAPISRDTLENAPRVKHRDLSTLDSPGKQHEVNTYFADEQGLRRPKPPSNLGIIRIK